MSQQGPVTVIALGPLLHVLPQWSLFKLLFPLALGATVGKGCLTLSASALQPSPASGTKGQLADACRPTE